MRFKLSVCRIIWMLFTIRIGVLVRITNCGLVFTASVSVVFVLLQNKKSTRNCIWRATVCDVWQCVTCDNLWRATVCDVRQCVTCDSMWRATVCDVRQYVTCDSMWRVTVCDVWQYVTCDSMWRVTVHTPRFRTVLTGDTNIEDGRIWEIGGTLAQLRKCDNRGNDGN